MFQIVVYISSTGFFVAAKEYPNPALQRKAGIPQGCQCVQGFYFAKPMAVQDYEKLFLGD